MKKTIVSFILILIAFTACEPLKEQVSQGGAITIEELEISATSVVVNGVRTNKVIVENHSPVLSRWECDSQISVYAYDELIISVTGEVEVLFTGQNPDGSRLTKKLMVTVDEIVY